MHIDLLIDVFTYLGLGLAAGLLSGLLGAGGGLITVPGLMLIFRFQSIPPDIGMHIAVGTSLATMIPIAFRSLRSHMRRNVVFYPVYKQLAPSVVVGVMGGAILAHFVHSHVLRIIFGVLVLVMAVSLLLQREDNTKKKLPGMFGMSILGGAVGVQSGLLGVAGSAFSVPFLTQRGVNMRVAVVVSVAIAMTVSVLGTATFMMTGLHASGLPPWSTGYVYWPALIGLAIGGVFMAPIGATWSHRIPARRLKQYFAAFLFAIGVHMLWF